MHKKKQLLEQKAALVAKRGELLEQAKTADNPVELLNQVDTVDAELGPIDVALSAIEKLEQKTRENASRISNPHDRREDAPFRNAGEFLQSVARAGTPGQQMDPRLHQFAPTGINEGVGEQGGFLVGEQVAAGIWRRAFESGQLLSRVNRIPIGAGFNSFKANYLKENARTAGNRHGGIQVYRRAEAATVTATKPVLAQFRLELESGMALVYATDEQMQDDAQMTNLANTLVPEAITFSLEDEILNGNGVGKCLGIMNAPSLVTVTKEAGQLGQTILAENINKMWARMWAPSRSRAVWFINQDIEPQLDALTIGAGAVNWPVYLPPGGLSGSPLASLKGRPVIPIEHCSTLGTVGDIILADLSQYVFIEKGGVDVATSIHVQFLYGEQVFRFMYRNNGGPGYSWAASALTPAKGSNTLSPFVVLATRA